MYLRQLSEYLEAIGYNKASKLVPLCALSLLVTVMELLSIILIFPIIQAFLDFDAFAQSKFAEVLSQVFSLSNASHVAIALVAMLAITIVLRGLLSFFGYRWIFRIISHDEAAFATREYGQLLRRDYLHFQTSETSKIIRDIAIAIPIGFSTVLQSLLILTSEVFVFSGIALYLLILNPSFFVSVLAILAVAAFFYGKMIGPVLGRLGRERHDLTHKTIGTISQSFEGIGQIKNWQGENFFSDIFGRQRHDQARIVAAQMSMQYLPKLYFESIVMMVICAALFYFLASGTIVSTFLPLLGFYVIAAFRSLPSVLRISAQYNVLISSRPGFETIISFGARNHNSADNKLPARPVHVSRDFVLENISFSYDEKTVISHLDLRLDKGDMVGLSGRSGEGKTTLVNIIVGLLPAAEGTISIDGQVLNHEVQDTLLRTVGYVSQNVFLLNDTIRANVAFGVAAVDIDEGRIRQALSFAQMDDFVKSLADGIFHVVGERGGRLSGGQRQRLGIARAFYFNRDILILDEATASLDEETESSFIEVLRALKGQKTVIVISHKAAPLSICDRVYEMKNGSLTVLSA